MLGLTLIFFIISCIYIYRYLNKYLHYIGRNWYCNFTKLNNEWGLGYIYISTSIELVCVLLQPTKLINHPKSISSSSGSGKFVGEFNFYSQPNDIDMVFIAWHSIAPYPHAILTGYPFMDGSYINCSLAKPITDPHQYPMQFRCSIPSHTSSWLPKKIVHPHEIPGKSPLLMGKSHPKWCV